MIEGMHAIYNHSFVFIKIYSAVVHDYYMAFKWNVTGDWYTDQNEGKQLIRTSSHANKDGLGHAVQAQWLTSANKLVMTAMALGSQKKLAIAMAICATSLASALTTVTLAKNSPEDYVELHNAVCAVAGAGPVSWDGENY